VLLHPFAPFVTEEIWDKLPGTEGSIMQAAYPQPRQYVVDQERLSQAEKEMAFVVALITGIRNIRGEMNIAPGAKLEAVVASAQSEIRQTVTAHQDLIINLARLNTLQIQDDDHRSPTAATAIVGDATLLVELKGVVDFAQEAQRLEKEIGKLTKELAGVEKKLGNQGFLSKAPAEVVAEVREKQALMSEKRDKLAVTLQKVKAFI
jgi:valyl-tRNA synthetase